VVTKTNALMTGTCPNEYIQIGTYQWP